MSLTAGELEVVTESPGAPLEPGAELGSIQGRSLGQIAWRRLRRAKVAVAGWLFAIFRVLVAILPKPLTSWYGQTPNAIHNVPPDDLLDPSTQMPLGSFG